MVGWLSDRSLSVFVEFSGQFTHIWCIRCVNNLSLCSFIVCFVAFFVPRFLLYVFLFSSCLTIIWLWLLLSWERKREYKWQCISVGIQAIFRTILWKYTINFFLLCRISIRSNMYGMLLESVQHFVQVRHKTERRFFFPCEWENKHAIHMWNFILSTDRKSNAVGETELSGFFSVVKTLSLIEQSCHNYPYA